VQFAGGIVEQIGIFQGAADVGGCVLGGGVSGACVFGACVLLLGACVAFGFGVVGTGVDGGFVTAFEQFPDAESSAQLGASGHNAGDNVEQTGFAQIWLVLFWLVMQRAWGQVVNECAAQLV
jgi:hypothetical protein